MSDHATVEVTHAAMRLLLDREQSPMRSIEKRSGAMFTRVGGPSRGAPPSFSVRGTPQQTQKARRLAAELLRTDTDASPVVSQEPVASQSIRECDQCTATTASGQRCRKRTCRGPVCWMHAKSQHGLRVKPSQVPTAGLGLYATRRLAKNARIAPYAGEKRTRAQVSERYGSDTGQYVLCRSDKECFDARKTNASLARFANDARGTEHTNNAKFTPGVPSGTPLLRATRPIPAGREIFTSYGREYWS